MKGYAPIRQWEIFMMVFIVFVSAFLFGMMTGMSREKHKTAADMQRLKYYDKNHLSKNGWMSEDIGGYGAYRLVSLDGGKNWYALDGKKIKNNEMVIVGSADKVYPHLLERLNAWDRLERMARNKEKNMDKKIKWLKQAGFEVIKTK